MFFLKLLLALASFYAPTQKTRPPVDDGPTYENPADCRVRIAGKRKVYNSACPAG